MNEQPTTKRDAACPATLADRPTLEFAQEFTFDADAHTVRNFVLGEGEEDYRTWEQGARSPWLHACLWFEISSSEACRSHPRTWILRKS